MILSFFLLGLFGGSSTHTGSSGAIHGGSGGHW